MSTIGSLNLGQLVDSDFFETKVVYRNGETTHEISRHPSASSSSWLMQLETSTPRQDGSFARTQRVVQLAECSQPVQSTLVNKFHTARAVDYTAVAEAWLAEQGITHDMLDVETYMNLQSTNGHTRFGARTVAINRRDQRARAQRWKAQHGIEDYMLDDKTTRELESNDPRTLRNARERALTRKHLADTATQRR